MSHLLQPSRRQLLAAGAALSVAAAAPTWSFAPQIADPVGEVVDQQPFARLEAVGDGLWAAVSTPLDSDGNFAHPQTLCNGGLIMGDNAVVAFDAFYAPAGAAWLSEQSLALTGRRPTHVIISHVHLDHSGGIAGYQRGAEGPEILMTEVTRKLILERYTTSSLKEGEDFARPGGRILGPTQVIHDESRTYDIDLGGRTITIHPLSGHTPSDLAVTISDAPVVFAGDLIWQGLFPNYVDAIPTALAQSCEALFSLGDDNLIVTGHGGLEKAGSLREPFMALLGAVESAARSGREAGLSPADAAKALELPSSVSSWGFFNPRYPEVAVTAWYREWDNA